MIQTLNTQENARKRCRIMHVNESAGGGVERYLQSLISGLDPERFESVLVCSPDYREESFQGKLAGFETVPQMRHAIGPWDIAAIRAVRRFIRKYLPDIVYAHSSKAGVYARLACRGMGCKCIYNAHGWSFNMQVSEAKRNAYATVERLLSRYCDRIVCVSEFEKASALERRIADADKLTVIMNGIDTGDRINPEGRVLTRDAIGIPGDAFVVGTVGRLSPQKAPDDFVRMARQLLSDVGQAYFLMVGSGELESEIRAQADACGLGDRLRITGWVDNAKEYIALFDVAVLLSRWEAFGLVLPEYMLMGKPIVATRTQGIPELIEDGVNGMLVDVGNWRQAAGAVERLRGNPELCDRLTADAAVRVRRDFSLKREIALHESLFSALFKASGSAST